MSVRLLLITSSMEEGGSLCHIVRIISLGSRAILEVAGLPRPLFPIIHIIISTTVDTIIRRTITIQTTILLSSNSRLPTLIIIMLAAAIIEGVTRLRHTAIIRPTININKNALLNRDKAALPARITADSRLYSPSITSSRARPRST